jgi:GMP synthase-like glutamine amidotransferase
MAIIVFQHDDLSRPGRLGVTLRDHAFKLDVRRLHAGDPVPPDYDNVDGVVSLGGRPNVDEGHGWIEREQAFLRGAHTRSLPVVGVCLGAQMVAAALGGAVGKMDRPEVGFTDVKLLPPAHTDTIMGGVAWTSPQFQTHHYEVTTLPEGAVHLATSERCAHQAFRVGMRTYCFQYHFEADRAMIDAFLKDARTDLHQSGATSDEFARDAEKKYEMFARLADRLCLNIATYLIPRVANAMKV